MQTPQPLPAGGLSREAIAKRDLGHTDVAPVTVGVLLAFFLAAIAVIPAIEVAAARSRSVRGETHAWSFVFGIPADLRAGVRADAPLSSWDRFVAANRVVLARLNDFERALEDESAFGRSLRPRAQVVMTQWLGAGNERVYPGRDGWLFYRPDVEHVTGRAFLDPAQVRRRIASAPEWTAPPQPDPRPAILRFKNDLAARGITLVVVPTPLKPGVHPDKLAARYADVSGVLHNPSYAGFVADLRRAGVLVFDPSEALAEARRAGPQYLLTDTHWRPETMEEIANRLGAFISASTELPPAPDPGHRIERVEVANRGDVLRMLDLPEMTAFPPETVWVNRVLQPDGSLWRSSRAADVLVLGDSFSNIYSLESMGWGTSAGFVEHVSDVLGRPIDRLVQNDEGAFATRAMLQRDPARLDGKRVVIYQFAVRELAVGDWKVLPLPDVAQGFSPAPPAQR